VIKPRKRDVRDGIGDKQMQENMKEYLTEKESREKRLEVYTEKIQEKVLSRSSEKIRQLVKKRHRQKMTQQEIADITGIKSSNMARFESGSRVPMLVVLEKYANPLENILK
jgi:predicted transcriptional regulator